jgi:hypothetical protein
MPGPITQLLALADLEPVPVASARAPRLRTRPSGTLLAWRIGIAIGTAWTAAMVVLVLATRY